MSSSSKYNKTNTEDEDRFEDDDEGLVVVATNHNNNNVVVVEPMEIGGGQLNNEAADDYDDTDGFTRGELQETKFRDKWFGIIFLVHLIIMILVGIMYGIGVLETNAVDVDIEDDGFDANNNDGNVRRSRERNLLFSRIRSRRRRGRFLEDDTTTTSFGGGGGGGGNDDDDFFYYLSAAEMLLWLILMIIIPTGICIGMMTIMKSHAKILIQCSLCFSIGFNILLAIFLILFVTPSSSEDVDVDYDYDDGGAGAGAGIIAAIPPIIFGLILICYAKAVWHRIPFAASNIRTAITVVQANLGMAGLALANIPLVSGWIVLWTYVASCVLSSPWFQRQQEIEIYDSQTNQDEPSITPQGFMAIVALLLSFYWTIQVLNNVVHTTQCGTVGTWWFVPHEANNCCSSGLTASLSRSLSYSFGSICLGSLLVAIIETLRSLFRSQARNRRGGIMTCIAQCLLHLIERFAKYFNKFAFVYVGLYGYSYIDAGKNVLSLFHHRGWSVIISDSLIVRMLLMMSFCVGLVTAGIMAILMWSLDGSLFVGSFFMGFLMSILIFNVLMSAVDSIIVLFAEAPREFHENHPELAQEMKVSWTQAWPDIFSPVSAAVGSTTGTVATATIVPRNYSDNADPSKVVPEAAPVSSLV